MPENNEVQTNDHQESLALSEHTEFSPENHPPLLPQRRSRFARLSTGLHNARSLLERSLPAPAPSLILPAQSIEESMPEQDTTTEIAKWTLRRDIPLAILAWTGVVLLVLWLLSHVTQTLLIIIIASLLAYALVPLVKLLERAIPRIIAIIIVYGIVLAALGALLYFVVSSAVTQIIALTHSVGNLVTPKHPGQLTPLEQILQPLGISPTQVEAARNQLLSQVGGLASSILPVLTGVAGAVLDMLLVLILSIYLLIEGSRVSRWLQNEMPRSQRGRIRFLLHTLQRIVGGYIRGQLIMSTLIGVLVGVGMFIFGVPYPLLLGVLAFILEFIPILGTITSGVICVLLALSKGWILALLVLGYFVLVHIFEGDIVGPRVVGKAVGLHPMVAIVALIAGSELFGIPGALFASPIAGVLQALILALWFEWREAHPESFQNFKQQATRAINEHTADHPIDPDPPEKLLS